MTSAGVQQFVLHLGKELSAFTLTFLLTCAEGNQVTLLLIKAFFRGAYVAVAHLNPPCFEVQ